MTLMRAIAAGDESKALRLLDGSPDLARLPLAAGASRQASTEFFLTAIAHYAYAGDTPLHIAAAAHAPAMARALLARGAGVRARNRRGAEPLHYAVDGGPNSPGWNAAAQEVTIRCLIEAGADPNAADKSGVAPLHRAARSRCAGAVQALLVAGADPRRSNGSGSTPLHLAVQNTGRGGSGTPAARDQQRAIIALLLKHGARPSDRNSAGRSVSDSVASQWVLEVLERS
jgi:hypothetical protein